MNKHLCVFAGTTEGRKTVEYLSGQPVKLTVCVATEYGAAVLPAGLPGQVITGRMDEAQMTDLFKRERFDFVIDASHPYAKLVSSNIAGACKRTGTACLRLLRAVETAPGVWVDSIPAAAEYLNGKTGNVLITTGAKELAAYTGVGDYQSRLYVRVLPDPQSIETCRQLGFSYDRIIAMQGPFSHALNAAVLREVKARYLVTKESGAQGGFPEKISAAMETGVTPVIVGRPKEEHEGMTLQQLFLYLQDRLGLTSTPEITLIGAGPGAEELLTGEARQALTACDCIIGAGRLLGLAEKYHKPMQAEFRAEAIAAFLKQHPEYGRVCILLSGDVGFFSGAKRLREVFAGGRVKQICGISSLVYLCGAVGIPWEQVKCVSLHGRRQPILTAVSENEYTFVLTDGPQGISDMLESLCRGGMGNVRVCVGERLSYPSQRITWGTARELCGREFDALSVVLVHYPDHCRKAAAYGIADSAFIRGKVPMTKSEIRSISLAKLNLGKDSVLYDVGAGTGSVAVEAALMMPEGTVYAVEKKAEGLALIGENRDKFGAGNLVPVPGCAPEALAGLAAPTHVFIGGSSGRLKEIIRCVRQKNPRVRIVINAVTLETLNTAVTQIKDLNFAYSEIIQVQVSRAQRAAGYHMMKAGNPVWIITMES